MRRLLLTALALSALPAVAQTDDTRTEREIIIERDDADGPQVRRMIIVNGDTTLDERRGGAAFFSDDGRNVVIEDDEVILDRSGGDGRAVRLRIESDGDEMIVRQGDGDEANVVRLRMPSLDGLATWRTDADGPAGLLPRMLREFQTRPGVSSETRQRMRALEMESQSLARRARSAEGDARQDALRELDDVLGELFEVRGEARREEATALREQAAALQAEADELDAATRDRASRRQALIDARRAELMGERASDW